MQKEIKSFYDLDAWKKAHEFTLQIYTMTKRLPKEELYGINSQFKKSGFIYFCKYR